MVYLTHDRLGQAGAAGDISGGGRFPASLGRLVTAMVLTVGQGWMLNYEMLSYALFAPALLSRARIVLPIVIVA